MQPMGGRCLMEKSHCSFFDDSSAKFKEHVGNLPFHVLNFLSIWGILKAVSAAKHVKYNKLME